MSGNSAFLGVRRLADHGAITDLARPAILANFGYKIAGQRHVRRDNGKVTTAVAMSQENVGYVTPARPNAIARGYALQVS